MADTERNFSLTPCGEKMLNAAVYEIRAGRTPSVVAIAARTQQTPQRVREEISEIAGSATTTSTGLNGETIVKQGVLVSELVSVAHSVASLKDARRLARATRGTGLPVVPRIQVRPTQ